MSDIGCLAAPFTGARRPVVFTGAGVSTESGIPDFRSRSGVWARFDPAELTYQNFVGSLEGRRRYWALGRAAYLVIRADAGPVMAAVMAAVAGAQTPPRRRGEPVTTRAHVPQGG